MRRAIINNGRGAVRLADGKSTPYNLDAVVQGGAGLGKFIPIARGDSVLLIVNEVHAQPGQGPHAPAGPAKQAQAGQAAQAPAGNARGQQAGKARAPA